MSLKLFGLVCDAKFRLFVISCCLCSLSSEYLAWSAANCCSFAICSGVFESSVATCSALISGVAHLTSACGCTCVSVDFTAFCSVLGGVYVHFLAEKASIIH
jgi:hypothetical protein